VRWAELDCILDLDYIGRGDRVERIGGIVRKRIVSFGRVQSYTILGFNSLAGTVG